MTPILVDTFSPFASQPPQIGLTFTYDPATVALLKAANQRHRWRAAPGQACGWQPAYRRWFVDPRVWPDVRRELIAAGCTLLDGPRDGQTWHQRPLDDRADERRSPYAVLGVAPSAPWAEVHAAYRDRVHRLHPDANPAAQLDPAVARLLNEATAALNAAFEAIRQAVQE